MKESRERRLLNSQSTNKPDFVVSIMSPTVQEACSKLNVSGRFEIYKNYALC